MPGQAVARLIPNAGWAAALCARRGIHRPGEPVAMSTTSLSSSPGRRPATAVALLASVLWIAWNIYEVARRGGTFSLGGSASLYLKVGTVIQQSALGVVGFFALALMIERLWPDSGSAGGAGFPAD
jgi:hypothetical protein